MQLGEGFIRVRPDTRDFDRDLQNQVEGGFGRAASNLRNALQFGATIAGFKSLTDAASTLEQAVGGTAAVFGESQSTIDEWAKGAAEAAGLSERAARELTSQIGGLLQGFGFAQDEAADMSITLAQLGADLAATFGGTTEEAVQALGAALRGETDPLERFGIALNQTLVNTKAVELGLATSTSAVDQNAKAQATLALITERSANAQGQFAREADTAAGQAQIAAAKTENASADLGENLLPIYTRIAETVGIVASAFAALPEPVQTALLVLGGIVALSGPMRAAFDVIAAGARVVSAGFDRAAIGAFNLAGNLGTATAAAGALGLVLVTGAAVLSDYQKRKAEAARIEDVFTQAIREQNDELGNNVDAVVGSELLKGELGEALREAGVDVAAFTDAIKGNEDELDRLVNDLPNVAGGFTSLEDSLENAGLAGTDLADQLLALNESGALTDEEFANLIFRLEGLSNAYKVGAREAENKAAADEAAGVEAKGAGDAAAGAAGGVDALGGAMGGAADETADLEEQLKGAREELEELLDIVNSAADSELAYRDALDDVESSLQKYLEANHLAVFLKGEDKAANEELSDAERDLERDILAAAKAAGESAEDQAKLAGQHFDAADKAKAQQDALRVLVSTLDPNSALARGLNEHIYRLAAIPQKRETTVLANTAQARDNLTAYLQLLNLANTDPAAALRAIQHPQTAGQPLGVGHAGYTVPGLPGQEVPVIALAGERIVPRGDPSLAGDGGGVDRSIHVGTIQVMPGADPVRALFDTARAEEFLGGLG